MPQTFRPTDEQRAVIEHEGSHALVSAVAGAGKTSTLVEHIARLVQRGMDPRRILPIQYNTSAKASMQRKLEQRLEGGLVPQARTFHSIGNAMLKRLVEMGAIAPATFQSAPGTYEELKRRNLRQAWKAAHGGDAFPSQDQIEGFGQFVTLAKANICDAREVFRQQGYPMECGAYLSALSMMDAEANERRIYFFDDMLKRTWDVLLNDPCLWDLFGWYDAVIVDEFQDINAVQYALLDGLVGESGTCMAIGDPDQTLYKFRGSDPAFLIEHFARDYTPCRTYTMSRTFRYGHRTALLANHIISNNQHRHDKLSIAGPGNYATQLRTSVVDPTSGTGLANMLAAAHRNGTLREHALLVRFFSQSVPYEVELVAAGIPFHVYGRAPLLLVPEIAALVAVVSLATGRWAVPEALRPILTGAILSAPTTYCPRETLQAAQFAITDAMAEGGSISAALVAYIGSGKVRDPKLADRLRRRADIIGLMEAGGLRTKAPAHIIDAYLGFTEFYDSLHKQAAARGQVVEAEQNVNALKQLAARYPDAGEFLDVLGPLAGQREGQAPSEPHLAIMSVHRAKGAEWPHVYLPGWAAGQFPRQGDDLEEERRVAYVAVTRAIKELVILHPVDKTLSKQNTDLTALVPPGSPVAASRFLYEAELGLSNKVADAIEQDRELQQPCRRDEIVNRYVEEAGIIGIHAFVTPELRTQLRQTDQHQDIEINEGERLRFGEQIYTVTRKMGKRYYYVACLSGGDPRLISLDEPGWMLA